MPIPPRAQGKAYVRSEISTPTRKYSIPIQQLMYAEQASGLSLLIGTVVALIWVNSPWAHVYHQLWGTVLTIDLNVLQISLDAHHWVNKGLMVLFFFLMGLEIKRELVHGQLSIWRQAALPAIAAVGGMILPTLIYLAFTWNSEGATAWGIPIATDIAFALGLLALLGSRIPRELKIFLLAFAVADDIGGVLVIALFYTRELSLWAIGAALVLIVFWLGLRRFEIQNRGIYVLIAILLWLAVLKSGIHPTIVGVIIGLLTPAHRYYRYEEFTYYAGRLVEEARGAIQQGEHERTSMLLGQLEELTRYTEESVERLERLIRPWVSYCVLPIFALANAGIVLSIEGVEAALGSPLALGILVALIVGKPMGILGGSWLAVRLKLAVLPPQVSWSHITGVALLGGMGFTVALFITSLAVEAVSLVSEARVGIFIASITAGLLGYFFLLLYGTRPPLQEQELDDKQKRTVWAIILSRLCARK
ncbi:Na+/H+ antiporter NhaA [Nitrosococcus wardiae]|uniref:Na(+)/H(+) antiporter NhaA n=1 Tax=Nitrosococcus wardiae TaxID=1814290 RepID=A0A4P7C1X2_9GAMM|nr:Na+/H+ antiporter NhaA [Nitrosococcus wardiae]QBQ55484.1 Na+/H+ antiporter NhaA [Nitrosococcus wardiae]